MRRKITLEIVLGLVIAGAAVIALILTASSRPANASPVFVDSVPTALPAQGVRINPAANVLLMPASVDAATLGISSAEDAIAKAPQNSVPKVARAILAYVTVGNGSADPGLDNRLAWVVTYQFDQSHPVVFPGKTSASGQLTVNHTTHGQVIIIDAQTGEFLLGFFMMDPDTASPSPSDRPTVQPSPSE